MKSSPFAIFILSICHSLNFLPSFPIKYLISKKFNFRCSTPTFAKFEKNERTKRGGGDASDRKEFKPRVKDTESFHSNAIRLARVSRVLRDELSEIITEVDIKAVVYPDENLLRSTSVVDIELSPDMSFAKVYISVLGNSVEKRQVFVWLCENVGQVRHSLASRLRHMRFIPEIFFKIVDNQAAADLINVIEEVAPKDRIAASKDIEFEED